MNKLNLLAISAAVAGVFGSSVAMAEIEGLSANLGAVTQYYYRGVQQTAGAAAQGGVDYEHASGLYVGVWGSDVGGHGDVSASDGIETDYYLGYGGEVSGFSYGLGYTSYQYTGDFDSAYNEVNLTAGYGPVSFEFSTGTHDAIVGTTVNDKDEDYTYTALTYEYEGISATYGLWGGDLEGAYFEVGYSKSLDKLDLGISVINGQAEDGPSAGSRNFATDGTAVVFSIGTTFDL